MTGHRVRAATAFCAAVTLFVAGAASARVLSSAHQPADADANRLAKLLHDRLAVRKQIVERFDKLKARGGASMVEHLVVTRDMLWAELETYTAKADRVAALERIVVHEKKIRDFYERSPDFTEVERLFLRVRLLDAEITLEREKRG